MTATIDQMLELLNLDVGGDFFAINITQVQEVRVLDAIRKMPDLPDGWLGVIDFRQSIVPIIDLRDVLSGTATELKPKTIIVVVQVCTADDAKTIGLVVDAVSEVISVDPESVRPPPKIQQSAKKAVQGLFKHDEHIVVILDLAVLIELNDFDGLRAQLADADDV
ncbi:chemotaxis protein CheW [Alteromonas sediminis]|uniref:Chemotaxis protein CheW n=1 Tax=Alteromonas sediminis TaxID=2259342 RepID=A0A3N5YER0_9ALTE|nr:chemotaxis protein CheW [Alteromonas sediminis]RPJ68335.1 chemotaxis protein CheW [Alteromonas sediminis]